MLYREIIAVCSQIHTKHINTLCGQNVELLNVKLAVHIVTTGLQRVKATGLGVFEGAERRQSAIEDYGNSFIPSRSQQERLCPRHERDTCSYLYMRMCSSRFTVMKCVPSASKHQISLRQRQTSLANHVKLLGEEGCSCCMVGAALSCCDIPSLLAVR